MTTQPSPATLVHFEAHVHVREHWEDWYKRVDANFDDFLLTNPLREFFETVMKDGTLGRKNRGLLTGVSFDEGWPKSKDIRSADPAKLTAVRDSVRNERVDWVSIYGFSRDNVYSWTVDVHRRGDEIGRYPNDHVVDVTWEGLPVSRELLARSGEVMFGMFIDALRRFPPFAGWLTLGERQDWAFEHGNNFIHVPMDHEPFTAGYRWGLFIPNADIERLGGLDRLRNEAPVEDVIVVEPADGTASPGIATRIRRDITALSEDDVRAWKQYLLPVLDLKPPHRAFMQARPVDVLHEDWAHPDGPLKTPTPPPPPGSVTALSKPKRPITREDLARVSRGEIKLEDLYK